MSAAGLALSFGGAPLSSLVELYAAAAIGLALLYLLKQRRKKVMVAFASLWMRALGDQERRPWRVPKRLASLLLQMAILTCIVGAAADPRLGVGSDGKSGRSIVIAVDASASMQARDEALPGSTAPVTRLERARYEAMRVVSTMSAHDRALVLILDGQPRPLSGFDGDPKALARQLESSSLSRATDAPVELRRGLRAAADLLADQPRPTLVVVGDGAWPRPVLDSVRLSARADRVPSGAAPEAHSSSEIDLRGVDVRYVPVGHTGDNVGIAAFAARRPPAGGAELSALVAVQRFGATPATVKLELLDEGEVVETVPLKLAPGQRVERRFDDLAGRGAHIEARIVPASNALADAGDAAALDAFALDDHALAVVPAARRQRLLLVTTGNLFLEGALLSDENVEVTRCLPARYDATRASIAAGFDAVIFDGFSPSAPPDLPTLYLDPRGHESPFSVAGELRMPIVTEVAARHPLMRFVGLFDLNVARASRFALAPGDTALASALRDPIYVARSAPHRSAALGFDVRRSDLPLRIAFPVLLQNLLRWFAGDDSQPPASASTAERVAIAWPDVTHAGALVRLHTPDDQTIDVPVVDGSVSFRAARIGSYDVTDGRSRRSVAVNLANAEESAIEPQRELILDGKRLSEPDPPAPRPLPIAELLVLAAMLLLLVELWTWHRRITE